MLIIYFLLGLGMTTAHSDYGVSSRAQNFDKTVQNIDKEAYIKHQREKMFVTGYSVPQNGTNRPSWGSNSSRDFVANVTRFQYGNRPSGDNGVIHNTEAEETVKNQRTKRLVTGYFVPQNLTNKPTWGNLNITRNHTTFTGPSNTSRTNAQKPNEQNVIVIYPVKNTTGLTLIKPGPNGNMTDVTGKINPVQNYNTNMTWPVYPTYNYIKVRPGYNINSNNTSNASGYTVPVNSVAPGNTPYPGYPGYPAPNTGYTVPNNGYPAPNTGYPAQNTSYPAPNTGYPASNTNPVQKYNTTVTRPSYPNYNNIVVRPVNKTNFNNSNPSGYNVQPVNPITPGITPYPGYPGYPAPNTGFSVPNTGYPAPNTGYPAQNMVYPAPNTGYPASNTNPVQNYNTTVTRPVYPPYYNNIIVRPVNKTNFNNSNPSGYNVQPVNPATPGITPYPGYPGYPAPNTGYPVPNTNFPAPNTGYPSGYAALNTGNLAPNTWYPVPNTGYPAQNTGYPVSNTGYRVPNTGYPAPNNGYPVPNTFYPPPSSVIPPANVTGFVPKPNPGFTIHDAVPRNNTNGLNNNATLTNCKCNLPRQNSTITKEERTMDACIIACNYCPDGMKRSAFGVCVKDLDYDDE